MDDEALALFGGSPAVDRALPRYESIGHDERRAVLAVLESQCLSGFYGSEGEEFFGGPMVRRLEAAWAARFGCKYALSVNSNTTGLLAALGAIGLGPGDEVIVPPTTMSASVVTPLFWGAIPVFADIEDSTFCIDPDAAAAAISDRTRAIIAVNLFGHPAELAALRRLADRHGIYLIEDNAQAPLATEYGRPCGTVGHIGVFSLNYHKHIHAGEGGICTTDDENLARRIALIRNHGENVHQALGIESAANVVGLNLRMTEITAAVAAAQLANAEQHVRPREKLAEALTRACRDLPGITPPAVREGCRHIYYCWTARIDAEILGISRKTFSAALAAEGFPHAIGYLEPLYMLPVFQQRKAIGRDGWPFCQINRVYTKGLCPTAERLHEREILLFEPCAYRLDDALTERLCRALRKVHLNRSALADWERSARTAAHAK